MQNLTNHNAPVIAGVEITTDEEGRFNLNALHKASGEDASKAPGRWLRAQQVKELINELECKLLKENQKPNMASAQKALNVVNGGTSPGTFAHELLAVSYAGWISPSFQLQVNQTFLDYRTGRLTPAPAPAFDPAQILSDPAAMRGLLLTYTEKVIALEQEVEEMKPDVAALKRIARSEGSTCITDAAKALQIRPKDFINYLSANSWIYRRAGGKSWLAIRKNTEWSART